MSRYNKLLNNKVIVLGLIGLAGWLVVSESYLWWERLSGSRQSRSDVSSQQIADSAEAPASSSTALTVDKVPTFAQVSGLPEGTFRYGGSTTWAPLREQIGSVLSDRVSNFQLQYTSPTAESGQTAGSGTGIEMLLSDELDFSQSSRPLIAEEQAAAQQKGYALGQIVIAIDGIAIAVNPDLGVEGLTVEQLKQIYSGEVTNWQELGGPDAKILPYARSVKDSGTAEFFSEAVLDGEQYAPRVQFVENTTIGIQRVSDDIGGIYYASAPEVVGQCSVKPLPLGDGSGGFSSPYEPPYVENSSCPRYRNQLNIEAFQSGSYPLTRELFVVVKQNGGVEEQAGLGYASLLLTDEAQSLIEEAGFVGAGNRN